MLLIFLIRVCLDDRSVHILYVLNIVSYNRQGCTMSKLKRGSWWELLLVLPMQFQRCPLRMRSL